MELIFFKSAKEYESKMIGFYKSTPNFIDNKSSIFSLISNSKGAYYHNTIQEMIGVMSNNKIICQCVLIKHKNFDGLMVAFFETEKNATQAVSIMVEYAKKFAKRVGAKRLIIAIDGHCDYSIGFSVGEHKTVPLFGESRNHDYYHDFFSEGFNSVEFSRYYGDFKQIYDETHTVLGFVKKKAKDITLRTADFSKFKDEISIYTDLSNRIFKEHWYYYHRENNEDFEFFTKLKPFLSPHNLIFAQKDGVDIGFILAYPDFNELVPINCRINFFTLLKHKFLKHSISTMKVAEIAVLPEYRIKGTVLLLFAEACKQAMLNYPSTQRVVSGWVMNDNHESLKITKRFAPNIYGNYFVYEKEL